jgi:hypothetical protein
MFIAVTGLVLVYMIPLGVADELRTGKEASPDQAIPMEKVVAIAVSQDLPGADSVEDIFRIEYRPSANVYQVRFNNGQGVQMDVTRRSSLLCMMEPSLVIGIDTVSSQ